MKSFRPVSLAGFIGQQTICARLHISIDAANIRNTPLGHSLFYGPPGLGKTTLASAIANDLGSQCHYIEGPMLKKPADLTGILMSLQPRDVVFIDEIHSLDNLVEEYLYHVMEDFVLDIISGQGDSARTLRIPVPMFTLIGATTMIGKMSKPLRDRFIFVFPMNYYNEEDMILIISQHAEFMQLEMSSEVVKLISTRSRGTPRIASRFLKWLRDFADHKKLSYLNINDANAAFAYLGVDKMGLDDMDRRILKVIRDKFHGGPVGIEAVSVALGEPVTSVVGVHEPFLIHNGFLRRTLRGRVLSSVAYDYLNKLDLIGL